MTKKNKFKLYYLMSDGHNEGRIVKDARINIDTQYTSLFTIFLSQNTAILSNFQYEATPVSGTCALVLWASAIPAVELTDRNIHAEDRKYNFEYKTLFYILYNTFG